MKKLTKKQISRMVPMSKTSIVKMMVGDLLVICEIEGSYFIYEISKIIDKDIKKQRLVVDLFAYNNKNLLTNINLFYIIYKERYVLYKSLPKKINKLLSL